MTFQKGDHVRVTDQGGIAFVVIGPEMETFLPEVDLDGWDEESAEAFLEFHGVEEDDWEERPTGNLVCVMVGDDRKHVIEPEFLEPLPRENFCGECGQIGCVHDGLVRS